MSEPIDQELAEVIEAWPHLSEKVRRDTVAMVRRELYVAVWTKSFLRGAAAHTNYNNARYEKRRRVLDMLDDPERGGWSDRKIAKACGVSYALVRKLRAEPIDYFVGRRPTSKNDVGLFWLRGVKRPQGKRH